MSSRIPVTLRVRIPSTWRVGHRLQVYTDFGGGAIDMDQPLLARSVEVFPTRMQSGGYGRSPYGRVPYGDLCASLKGGGYGREPYGGGPYGGGNDYRELNVYVPDAYGLHKFAVVAVDEEGNVQSGDPIEIEEMVSGTDPEPLGAFAFAFYIQPLSRAVFTFATE